MKPTDDELRAILARLDREGVSVEPEENRSWLRSFWRVAVVFACVAVGAVLVAAVSGHLTEKQQLHLLGRLITYGCVLLLPGVVLFNVVREYRGSGDWKAWLQFAAALVPFVGFWAWTGYFAEHGAFILWPVICFVAFWALIIAHGRAAEKRQKEYAEAVRDAPLPPPTTTPPQSSKARLKEKGLL